MTSSVFPNLETCFLAIKFLPGSKEKRRKEKEKKRKVMTNPSVISDSGCLSFKLLAPGSKSQQLWVSLYLKFAHGSLPCDLSPLGKRHLFPFSFKIKSVKLYAGTGNDTGFHYVHIQQSKATIFTTVLKFCSGVSLPWISIKSSHYFITQCYPNTNNIMIDISPFGFFTNEDTKVK